MHADILTFGLYALFASLFLVMVIGDKKSRPELLKGLVLFCLVASFGLFGFLIAVFLIAIHGRMDISRRRLGKNIFIYLAVIVAILCLSSAGNILINLSGKILSYLKPVADVAKQSNLEIKYPGITQSVIEAQNIEWQVLLRNMTGNVYLSVFALLGFVFLLYRRPTTLLLLPFAVMSIAAVKLGGRFSMFSGIVLGLGGSYFLYRIINIFPFFKKNKILCRAVASMSILSMLLVSILPDYTRTAATPIIYQDHAKALIAASKFAPEDSTFWTWWDWGYATMYFTEKNSFADGSRHGGSLLFPLAFAYATPSYLQSSQFMKYCALKGGNPSTAWDKMNVQDVQEMIYSMGYKKMGYSNEPKQYIVTSWSDVRLASWILYYGSFDLATGRGKHPEVSTIGAAFDLDGENGRLNFRTGGSIPLSGYDIVQKGRGESKIYSESVGPYLIFNKSLNRGYLVDDFARNSILFRLLLCNPDDSAVKNNFKLVYDGYPMVRIYEVI